MLNQVRVTINPLPNAEGVEILITIETEKSKEEERNAKYHNKTPEELAEKWMETENDYNDEDEGILYDNFD